MPNNIKDILWDSFMLSIKIFTTYEIYIETYVSLYKTIWFGSLSTIFLCIPALIWNVFFYCLLSTNHWADSGWHIVLWNLLHFRNSQSSKGNVKILIRQLKEQKHTQCTSVFKIGSKNSWGYPNLSIIKNVIILA